ncbi:MAG: hypothetical protein B7Y90_13890 [Alphaproteobacteria bacterium 32-64-14]|nr:MAG: hypothetical protein B7Y90_13890 [Alphaproteobacteria bacterium 32-64-14]
MTEAIKDIHPDTLNRAVKMAIDSGEAATIEDAYRLFAQYRLSVSLSAEAARSPAHQVALLTIVNAGRRAFLGGVHVWGDLEAALAINLPGATLRDAVLAHGGQPANAAPEAGPVILLGEHGPVASSLALQATFSGLACGVFPAGEGERLPEETSAILPAILAGALAMSELFQNVRGNPMAGLREVGLSLWDPAADWRSANNPGTYFIPDRLWILGLGHLGQALVWILGLLPFEDPAAIQLTLQDFDQLTLANDSTSVLTTAALVGDRKTRATAAWAEARGFRTRLVERRFSGDVRLQEDDPRVAFCGVDNAAARAALEDAGFDLVVEAGLGGGPKEYLAMRLHTFPATRTARSIWTTGGEADDAALSASAYRDLEARGLDKCGLVELATRTVGAPFVGLVAASLALGEMIRRLGGKPGIEVFDLTLRDTTLRRIVATTTNLQAINPGFVEIHSSRAGVLPKKEAAAS